MTITAFNYSKFSFILRIVSLLTVRFRKNVTFYFRMRTPNTRSSPDSESTARIDAVWSRDFTNVNKKKLIIKRTSKLSNVKYYLAALVP
jgi:hypothetical protein